MVLQLVVCNNCWEQLDAPHLLRHQLHRRPMSVQDAESLQDRVAIGVWFADSRANYPVNDHADRGISVHLRVCGS